MILEKKSYLKILQEHILKPHTEIVLAQQIYLEEIKLIYTFSRNLYFTSMHLISDYMIQHLGIRLTWLLVIKIT